MYVTSKSTWDRPVFQAYLSICLSVSPCSFVLNLEIAKKTFGAMMGFELRANAVETSSAGSTFPTFQNKDLQFSKFLGSSCLLNWCEKFGSDGAIF